MLLLVVVLRTDFHEAQSQTKQALDGFSILVKTSSKPWGNRQAHVKPCLAAMPNRQPLGSAATETDTTAAARPNKTLHHKHNARSRPSPLVTRVQVPTDGVWECAAPQLHLQGLRVWPGLPGEQPIPGS